MANPLIPRFRASRLPSFLMALGLARSVLAGAAGEPAAVPLSPQALVARALERSPELAAARAEVEAALSSVSPAGALPDPMLTLSYENDGTSISLGEEPMTRLSLMGEQTLPFPGKLRLASEVASAEARVSETAVARAELSVTAQVLRAWATLAEAREAARLTDEQGGTWKGIEEGTRARYAAGMGSQQDVLRAQSERTRLLQQRRRDEAAIRGAESELRRLLFAGPDEALPAVAELPREVPAIPGSEESLARAEERSPELLGARVSGERERLAADLARLGTRPDFVAQAAYMNRGSLPLMWSVSAGVTLPLWAGRKQKPLELAADRRLAAARERERDVRARLTAVTTERLALLSDLSEEVRLDREALLVQDRLAVEAALASYRAGSVPFVTVLEAVATEFADRRAALGRLATLHRTLADLGELSLDPAGPSMAAAPMARPRSSAPAAAGM